MTPSGTVTSTRIKTALRAATGIRGRVLLIALVPSLALLGAGCGESAYLIGQGTHAKNWAAQIRRSTDPGITLTRGLETERRLTIAKIDGDEHISASQFAAARGQTDMALLAMGQATNTLGPLDPSTISTIITQIVPLTSELPAIRGKTDTGALSATDAYNFYSQVLGLAVMSLDVIVHTAPDPGTAAAESSAIRLFHVLEAMSRTASLYGPAANRAGLSATQLIEFSTQIGFYHAEVATLLANLPPGEQAQLKALLAGEDWQRLDEIERAVIRAGAAPDEPAVSAADAANWQASAQRVNDALLALYESHQDYTLGVATANGQRRADNSLLAGGGILALSITAFLVALWLSNRLVRRLRRLRGQTLALADDELPGIMARLAAGETVDLDREVTPLEYGHDEIGEVAEAFNKAQHAALAAAVTEARTRDGVKSVFLNIAHRSQVVMHRQLKILEQAQYEFDDPGYLETLFRLDHLATRERRNAENLIILGGEQPARRWRNPVPLAELVRSAITETEDFSRVQVGKLPELWIAGSVVADLVHLLAELVDNATSFSPPQSTTTVSGNVIGKGVVVEIIDQGLGIPEEDLRRFNETLSDPPDFSVATLSTDSRLGIFVVARLAGRNGISVRLAESDYGGIRAIVVVPNSLIAEAPARPDDAQPVADAQPSPHVRQTSDPTPVGPDDTDPTAERVPLPRRRRQSAAAATPAAAPASARPKSGETIRDLYAAIEDGTRRSRLDTEGE